MTKKRASAYLIFTLLAMLALTSQLSYCEEAIPETMVLTVYPDGFVLIEYTLAVDKISPTQNITVFGNILEDLIVVNSNGLPLSYSLNYSILSVYSLGTEEISITYLTQDLTSKEGRYWILRMTPPITTRILLPVDAVIISLNKVPDMIETSNNKVTLLMNTGLIEVTYVIGIVGTEEHAQLILDEAETALITIKSLGIIITEAETKLQNAENAFDLGNFAEAEAFGNEAKSLAIQINQTATQAQTKIAEAQTKIATAEKEQRTVGLTDAKDLLSQANSAHDLGNYSEALTLATQTIVEAENSSFSEESATFPVLEILGVIVILVVAVLGLFFVKSRKEPKEAEVKTKKRQIDTERIFRENKDLMPDEKQAIQFLVDNNGEAFEAELYDYVKLPRTTTWRLVKRLKRMGIINVTKFRRQNLVRLKTKYDHKE